MIEIFAVPRIGRGAARLGQVEIPVVEGIGEGDKVITNPDVKGLEDGARISISER